MSTTSSPPSDSHHLGQIAAKLDNPKEAALNNVHQEMINFADEGPPSLNHPLTEEFFHTEQHPHIFWANLCIPLPPNPVDPFEALYDRLVDFVAAMTDEDDRFAVLPYHLSSYQDTDDIPPPIDDPDLIPDEIDEWKMYFPDAKPWARGSDLYTAVLVGLGKPFC